MRTNVRTHLRKKKHGKSIVRTHHRKIRRRMRFRIGGKIIQLTERDSGGYSEAMIYNPEKIKTSEQLAEMIRDRLPSLSEDRVQEIAKKEIPTKDICLCDEPRFILGSDKCMLCQKRIR